MQLLRFFGSLFRHALSGMTGALSLPLGIAAAWAPDLSQKLLYGALAITCFITAAYKVWQVEFRRARELEALLLRSRPLVVPEVVGKYPNVSIVVSNVGDLPATTVTIGRLGTESRAIVFSPVQMLRREDGRIPVETSFLGAHTLVDVLNFIDLVKTVSLVRAGQGKDDEIFEVPLSLRYFDANGQPYEDDSFVFAFAASPQNIAVETRLIIRRQA
ncbi:MAG: hypothetical protein WA208_07830 [Thermoanaerobaculia bacterium]